MISVQDIQKLASLARIKLSPEEETRFARDMDGVLGFVQKIQEVSSSVDSQKEKIRNVLRDDKNPHESGMYTEALLAEVPHTEGEYIKVKKIL